MSQHTPGPWKVSGGGTVVITEDGKWLANTLGSDVGACEDDANARLIAAAPEMLALLHQAAELMPLGTKVRADWLRETGAVLAKAEGRTP